MLDLIQMIGVPTSFEDTGEFFAELVGTVFRATAAGGTFRPPVLSGILTSVPKSAAVSSAVCRAPHPTALSPSLLHQGHDEENPEAPGCSGERSLFLLTKVHHVGTSLLAAAIASSERHCSASRGEGICGVPKPPSNGLFVLTIGSRVSAFVSRQHSKQRPDLSLASWESVQR